jgi:hypothetical protein
MLNEEAYKAALKAFDRGASSVHGCLRRAIEAYRLAELNELCAQRSVGPVTVSIADTEAGSLAVVVDGFKTLVETEWFIKERIDEARQ